MKIKVQLVMCAEDGREAQVQEVAMLEKPYQPIEHLGFTLAEAKSVLKTFQHHLVAQQAMAFVAAHAQCHDGGTTLGSQGHHTCTFRRRSRHVSSGSGRRPPGPSALHGRVKTRPAGTLGAASEIA